MSLEMKLPQFGMGMTEAVVVRWLKSEGDRVEKGEALVDIEAAKTSVEVPAPETGVLLKIVAEEGATVPVYDVLALIETENIASPPAPPPASVEADEASLPQAPVATEATNRISPRLRRLAQEHSVSLDSVVGTGPGGRIEEGDILAAAKGPKGLPEETVVPFTSMRKLISRRMHASLQGAAQLTLTRQIDMEELVQFRARLPAGTRVTINDLILAATTLALIEHPGLNSTVEELATKIHGRIDLGIAMATPEGLMVPVLQGVEALSLTQLAEARGDLLERVKQKKAKYDDLAGSTFTVTNLGSAGIDAFTPILNAPESAILGVGRMTEQPTRGKDDQVVWRRAAVFSLTIDHRIIDGAPGAAFLQTLADILAQPDKYLR